MLLSERIRQDGITIDYTQRDRPPEGEQNPGTDMRWWDVTLTLDEEDFGIPWGMGPAAGDEPELDEVMSMVTMSVRAVINNHSFAEWCDEWGFDPAEPGRYESYEEWIRVSGRLLMFLGGKRYSAYLHDTEDDI